MKTNTMRKLTFENIYEDYYDLVVGVAQGVVKVRQDAEDVAQDVFINVLKALDNGKVPKNVKNWIFTIAKNEAIDFATGKVNTVQIIDNIQTDSSIEDSKMDADTYYQAGYDIVSQMGEGFLFVYIYYYSNGYTTREISEELEISDNLVRQRLMKIKKELKKLTDHQK